MPKSSTKSRIPFLLATFLILPSFVFAATPTISNVTGTVATGNTLTIAGSNLSSENTSGWQWSSAFGGFETGTAGARMVSSDWTNDWATYEASYPRQFAYYDNNERILGNQSMRIDLYSSDETWTGTAWRIDGSGGVHTWSYASTPMYFRWYFKYPLNFPVPTEVLKQAMVGHTYVQPAYPSTSGISYWIFNDGSGGYHPVPSTLYGGMMPWGKWYCVELMKTGTTSQIWIDGISIGTDSWSNSDSGTTTSMTIGMPNAAGFPANFGTTSIWFDGVIASTSRIYPAALVEISNNFTHGSGTVVKQHINYISDSSISFEANLSGLGNGPYYLWVTNNGQTTSAAYNLSGGGGRDTTAPGAPTGMSVR